MSSLMVFSVKMTLMEPYCHLANPAEKQGFPQQLNLLIRSVQSSKFLQGISQLNSNQIVNIFMFWE